MPSLQARIEKASEEIQDVALRKVRILNDREALVIATEVGRPVREVFVEALRGGICPARYVRNRTVIPQEDQLRLALATVGVVGAGGLGGWVILLLARVGVGRLIVIDQDVFEETNLNRQALSSPAALGAPKSDEALRIVASLNPAVEVSAHVTGIREDNVRVLLQDADVVVDALDNVPDRLLLDKAARDLGIPLVHGAIAGFEGQVMTVFPGDPGLSVLYGGKTATRKDPESPEAVLGVPTVTPAVVGALQAMEVLKVLTKRDTLFRRAMAYLDLDSGQLSRFTF